MNAPEIHIEFLGWADPTSTLFEYRGIKFKKTYALLGTDRMFSTDCGLNAATRGGMINKIDAMLDKEGKK